MGQNFLFNKISLKSLEDIFLMNMCDAFKILKVFPFNQLGFVGFYGISIFVGYLTPNLFLCIWLVLFQTIQFSIRTQFNCQKHSFSLVQVQILITQLNVKTVLYITIQFSVSTVSMSKTAPHSPKLQHHWNLTIRLFSVTSGHSLWVGGGLTPLQRCSRCILQPQLTVKNQLGSHSEIYVKNGVTSNVLLY